MRLRPHLLRSCAALAVATALSISMPSTAGAQMFDVGPSVAGAYLAARAAEIRYDLAAAAAFYSEVYERDPGNIALGARILSLWVEAGQVRRATNIAESILAADRGYEPARLVLAAEAIKDGDFGDARGHLEAIAGDSFTDLSTTLLVGWIEFGEGDTDAALARLAEGGDNGALLTDFHAALIADLEGRSDEALALIEPLYDPAQSQRVIEAYVRILARTGDVPQAVAVAAQFLEEVPDHPRLADLLAQIESGADIAPMVETAGEGAAEVFYGLASTLIAAEQFQVGINYLQIARYIGPSSDLATILLGQLLQAQDRYAEAVQVFDSLGEDSLYAANAIIAASIADASRGMSDGAIARLQPLVEADPANAQAADALASIYRSEMRWQDANDVLSATIDALESIDARHWRLFYARGISFERVGDWDDAERDFRRALVLSPDQPDVLNYLGYSLIDQGVNYVEALDMIQRAVEQRPNSGYIIDSLGWAYYKLGDYETAVAILERAIELAPTQPEVHEHLGDALWRAGRRLEAQFQWNHTLNYDPPADMRERIETKLEDGLSETTEGAGVMEIR